MNKDKIQPLKDPVLLRLSMERLWNKQIMKFLKRTGEYAKKLCNLILSIKPEAYLKSRTIYKEWCKTSQWMLEDYNLQKALHYQSQKFHDLQAALT